MSARVPLVLTSMPVLFVDVRFVRDTFPVVIRESTYTPVRHSKCTRIHPCMDCSDMPNVRGRIAAWLVLPTARALA